MRRKRPSRSWKLEKMPRPGPRPYECVRRAWHSDRHQPIRGSIIQQVFRLVNEAHSSRTKKNREWQEKLPIVVLKAEEIMYSKANSEAEYVDLETLWDRVNDAVNTIIRKEDNNETGELLQPCIEAALSLGCIAVRASRSQRHNNPRTYLTPRAQEPTTAPPRVFDNTANERCTQLPLCQPGNQLTFARPTTANSYLLVPESDRHVTQNHNPNPPRSFPFLYENLPPRIAQPVAMESNTPLNLGSVYPLYYGTHYHSEESSTGLRTSENENASNTIFVGTPVGTSILKHSKQGVLQNLFSSGSGECALNRFTQADIRDACVKATETECDLSLQLGLSTGLFTSMGKNAASETIDVGSCSSDEGEKCSYLSPQKGKEICFFPRKAGFDPSDSCSSERNSKGGGLDMESTARKRKVPFSKGVEDGQFCGQPELPSNQFTARTKWPGL